MDEGSLYLPRGEGVGCARWSLPKFEGVSVDADSKIITINPATAAKGLTLLAEKKILYSKRGLGKFVTPEAKAIIVNKRKNQTLKKLLEDLVIEAERLKVDEQELMQLLQQEITNRKGEV
ncbi:hypothetical protein AFK71_10410 [Virgibacillus pantothenticus]|uniref:HTH gntR-type domain-containing protein n=1 Tax=Virgibacillus pantothenticus TaxID=1473 RepID=A0A0L0QRN2_VIRPA|nr:hypothetical protein AFK71_10410 [Virgibacillus pantothenticus]